MKGHKVEIGFEVGTGEPVWVPVDNHLCVTGQTQLSGKTTTLEALIDRAGVTAVSFITKRGEGSFATAKRIAPFFAHKADWQFVSDLLGAVLNEKLKFERSWIMRVSKGAKSLAEVQANTTRALASSKRSLDVSVLTTIEEYFALFMPELERLPYTEDLTLGEGINVMDLSGYSLPLQMLVIAATADRVYRERKNTVTVIPEAWEFLPQGKSSPAKRAVVSLIRKGGGLGNFVWPDSQDLAGLDKEIVRMCGTFILGVQREANEVERILKNIPNGVSKPKADELMTLQRGQFFVCHGREVRKVYVRPVWLPASIARDIARGLPLNADQWKSEWLEARAGDRMRGRKSARVDNSKPIVIDDLDDHGGTFAVNTTVARAQGKFDGSDTDPRWETPMGAGVTKREAIDVDDSERRGYIETIERLESSVQRLQEEVKRLSGGASSAPAGFAPETDDKHGAFAGGLVEQVIQRLRKDAVVIELLRQKPSIEVHVQTHIIKLDDMTLQGRVAVLLSEGFFTGTPKKASAAATAMAKRSERFRQYRVKWILGRSWHGGQTKERLRENQMPDQRPIEQIILDRLQNQRQAAQNALYEAENITRERKAAYEQSCKAVQDIEGTIEREAKA